MRVAMALLAASFGRHRVIYVLVATFLLLAAAVPVTAFVVVPVFVRSTVNEKAPGASAKTQNTSALGSAATPAPDQPTAESKTLATGDLRRINAVDFGKGTVLIVQVGDKP